MFASNKTVAPSPNKFTLSDCIVCLFRPMLSITSLVGIIPVTINCAHSKRPVKNACCKWSFYHVIVTSVLLLFLIFAIFMYVYLAISCKEKLECMEIISETIFMINSAIIVAFSLFKNNIRIMYLNAWIETFKKRNNYGFKTLIDDTNMKLVWDYCKTYKIFIVILLTFYSITYYFFIIQNLSGWLHLTRITSLVGIVIQLLLVMEYSVYNIFTRIIMDVCYASLVDSMIKIIPGTIKPEIYKKIEIQSSIRSTLSLEERIRQTRRFHSVIILNMEFIVKALNPTAVLWLSSNLAILIINTYVLCFMFCNSITNYAIVLQFKTYLLIICILYLLKLIQEAGKKVICFGN